MNAGIFLGGMERHRYPGAGMKADARAIDRRFQGPLINEAAWFRRIVFS